MGPGTTLIVRLREVETMIERLFRNQNDGTPEDLPDVELAEWERRRAVGEEAARRRWGTP